MNEQQFEELKTDFTELCEVTLKVQQKWGNLDLVDATLTAEQRAIMEELGAKYQPLLDSLDD